ncbi:MAG: putative periplasmic or secreted lipoprotein [Betaproteobacteria bacterium]|nr:putative periplasmic or secreted lipoprotein [Betaproteobacteria bacterium]
MNLQKLRLIALIIVMPMLAANLAGCVAAVVGGAGGAALVGADRRTVGTVTEDEGIELKAANRIRDKYKDAHFNLTSFSRMVLITGEATDASMKSDIEKIVAAVDNVRGVYNEMAIGAPTALSARANDSFVTSKVKARFVDQQKFNAVHVKVVTEANVVYLLGLVKRKEGDDAVEIARTTSGVQRVVKLFEYID